MRKKDSAAGEIVPCLKQEPGVETGLSISSIPLLLWVLLPLGHPCSGEGLGGVSGLFTGRGRMYKSSQEETSSESPFFFFAGRSLSDPTPE